MGGTAALIVAGGRGTRVGGPVPKQYRTLGGKAILRRAIEAFAARPDIAAVQVVIGEDDHSRYSEIAAGLNLLPPVAGGDTRQHSVLHGLQALTAHRPDSVLIHDAARPLVSQALIGRVIAALKDCEAAVPLLPVADTLKKKKTDGRWETVPRDGLHRAQTPQGFHFEPIVDAHRKFAGKNMTDDMALAEAYGLTIAAVAGEDSNLKITTEEDFRLAEKLLGGGEVRTGMGFDAHRFAAGDHVWLCGVKIAHAQGLEGHSDADAGLHALTDALLGAIGAGDIGMHFPPMDAKWRGAQSSVFLEYAARLVREMRGAIVNCDVTLICERPKIAPHVPAMRARIAEILGIDPARVSVKATTTEGMGFTGRGEGIAAQAIATVTLP